MLQYSHAAAFIEKKNIFGGKIKIDLLTVIHLHDFIGDQSNRHSLIIDVDDLVVALILRVQKLAGEVQVSLLLSQLDTLQFDSHLDLLLSGLRANLIQLRGGQLKQ